LGQFHTERARHVTLFTIAFDCNVMGLVKSSVGPTIILTLGVSIRTTLVTPDGPNYKLRFNRHTHGTVDLLSGHYVVKVRAVDKRLGRLLFNLFIKTKERLTYLLRDLLQELGRLPPGLYFD
jgi:hypothetical protein